MLLQADTVDETMHWLRGYLAALAAKAPSEVVESVLAEPVAGQVLADVVAKL